MHEETLTLPMAGHEYTVSQPSGRVGLAIIASFTIANARRKRDKPPAAAIAQYNARYAEGEHSIDVDALGAENYERMLDELTLPQLKRASMAARVWIASTGMSNDPELARTAALAVLADDEPEGAEGEDPKASTAAASTTKRRASTSGTTSRKKSVKATSKSE